MLKHPCKQIAEPHLVYPAVAGNHREIRSRQLDDVNPDARPRLCRRYLAHGRIGAERGVQFPDRVLETRDVPAVAGAGFRAAAREAYRFDPA